MRSRLVCFVLAVALAVAAVPIVQQAAAKSGLWKEIVLLSVLLVAGGYFWISTRYLSLWDQVALSALFSLGLVAPLAFGSTALRRPRHDTVPFSSEYWTEAALAFLGAFLLVALYLGTCSIARKQLGRLERYEVKNLLIVLLALLYLLFSLGLAGLGGLTLVALSLAAASLVLIGLAVSDARRTSK